MPAARANHATRKKVLLLIVGLLGVAALFEVRFLIKFFSIKEISCQLDGKECPASVQQAVSVLKGKSLFATDYQEILREQSLPLPITLQSIKKHLPQRIELAFSTQTLAYQLLTSEGTVAVTATGIPFKENATQAATSIELKPTYSDVLASPEQIKPEVHEPLQKLANALQTTQLAVEKVSWVDKDTIILIMKSEQHTALLDASDPEAAIKKLQLILNSAEYQAVAPKVKEIDLRFTLPVLRMRQ